MLPKKKNTEQLFARLFSLTAVENMVTPITVVMHHVP